MLNHQTGFKKYKLGGSETDKLLLTAADNQLRVHVNDLLDADMEVEGELSPEPVLESDDDFSFQQ